jgi:hypothetical protein
MGTSTPSWRQAGRWRAAARGTLVEANPGSHERQPTIKEDEL